MKIGEFSFVVRTKKYWFIYKNNQFEVIFFGQIYLFSFKAF
jgi:hypothetical protein